MLNIASYRDNIINKPMSNTLPIYFHSCPICINVVYFLYPIELF